ncbi:hypothetical protein B4117_5489 [Bacillus mycoides]|nr:hypothetical protein B4117_5489 [Bacillus mycoides]
MDEKVIIYGVRQPFLLFGATRKYKEREVMFSYNHFSFFLLA